MTPPAVTPPFTLFHQVSALPISPLSSTSCRVAPRQGTIQPASANTGSPSLGHFCIRQYRPICPGQPLGALTALLRCPAAHNSPSTSLRAGPSVGTKDKTANTPAPRHSSSLFCEFPSPGFEMLFSNLDPLLLAKVICSGT